jgi:outer membrane protein assembly factor BamB
MPSAPSLIVLNKWSGQLAAKDDGRISAGVFHGQWSSPTLGTTSGQSAIFFGAGDGWCYAFAPVAPPSAAVASTNTSVSTAGTTAPSVGAAASAPSAPGPALLKNIWRFDCNPPGYRSRNGRPIDYWALVRGGSREFLDGGRLVSPSEIIGTPVFYCDRLYVTIGQDPVHGPGAGALTCIAPTGQGDITPSGCVWQYTEIGRSMSTVSVADNLVFAAEHAGKVHCLDAETGQVYWVHNTGEEIWSSTLVADGKLYVGTRRGLVVLAAEREQRALADIRLGSAVWSAPTAAGGRLYVASQRNLWAVEDKGEIAD